MPWGHCLLLILKSPSTARSDLYDYEILGTPPILRWGNVQPDTAPFTSQPW